MSVRPTRHIRESSLAGFRKQRVLVWRGALNVSVNDIPSSIDKAVEIVASKKGYVERKSANGERKASLLLRVPPKELAVVMNEISTLGEVNYRYLSSKDVTEQYIDIQARIRNKIALRDKLKELLEKTKNIQDILAVEKELNRVQSDIDSMSGRFKALKGRVDLAELNVEFKRAKILGPLGYLFEGIAWGLAKLFVIRN